MARTGRQVQHNPLGQRIMAYRKKMNLTMQQLADQLGISESYISFIESGHRSPSRKLIKKLIHFFYPQGNPHLLDEWLVLAGFSPESPQTLMQLQQAQSVLEAQIHVNPSDLRAQFGLIRNLIKNEQLDQARQQIQLCLQLFHGSVEVQSLIGSLELAKGNFDQAIRAQQLAVDLYKSSESNDHTLSQTDLLLSLGVSYFLKSYDQLAQAQTSSKKKAESQAL